MKNRKNILSSSLFVLIPVVSVGIVLLIQRVHFSSIYLPQSQWNDEVLYYKIIEGTAQYGYPRGYFGYNESTARILTFGAWSPFVIWPQIMWGSLFGWHMSSPLVSSIILLCIVYAIIAFVAHPTFTQAGRGAILISSYTIMSRYILSGMAETNCLFSLLLLCAGLIVQYQNQRFSMGWWIYSNVLLMICTLMRGYYVIFAIFLVYNLWVKKKKRLIIIQILLCASFLALYFLTTSHLCAPYYSPLIKTDWIKLFFIDFQQGLNNFIQLSKREIKYLVILIYKGLRYGDTIGGCYTIFWIVGCIFLIKAIHCPIYRLWSFMWIVIQLAMIYLYDVYTGSRHVLVFTYVGLLYLVYKNNRKKVFYVALAALILFSNRGLYNNQYYWKLPRYNTAVNEELEKGADQMQQTIQLNKDNNWDNTIYFVADAADWHMLYAVPAGMGIEWGNQNDVLDDYHGIQSKYIFVSDEFDVDNYIANQENSSIVAEYGGVHIWDTGK